jgi:opacity protein-like surface antigen
MKKNYKLLFCLIAAVLLSNYSVSLLSQTRYQKESGLEISAQGTYFFGGILPTTYGDINFVNNFGLLTDLSYKITRSTGINISYTYIPTELRYTDYRNYGQETSLFDMDVHYFFFNYLYESENRGAVPYGIIGIGGVLADPKDNNYGSELRFATNFGGGIKINASSKVGFKIQARLLIPVIYSAGTVFVDPYGLGYGVSTGGMIQADLSAGLSVKF